MASRTADVDPTRDPPTYLLNEEATDDLDVPLLEFFAERRYGVRRVARARTTEVTLVGVPAIKGRRRQ
jgi:hypothetical protein